ncbi:unnamed protein product, partial [Tuber aestivum]
YTKRTAISSNIICRIHHPLLTSLTPHREGKKKKRTTQIAIYLPTYSCYS